MKVFISSLISGMEAERAAAKRAIEALRHEAVMAEDFGARASTPQVACLTGLRQSDLVVLVLGTRYGTKQASGLSATHEEYREARGRKPILIFVQVGEPEADQATLIDETGSWESGLFRASFSTADELRDVVTRALHDYAITHASNPLDTDAMLRRATDLMPGRDHRHSSTAGLHLTISAGPEGAILRPAELESPELSKAMEQQALFGVPALFDRRMGTESQIQSGALTVVQKRSHDIQSEIRLWGTGDLRILLPVLDEESRGAGLPVVIEETVASRLSAAIAYAAWLLTYVDPTERITHVTMAAALVGEGVMGWRTRREHAASPNSGSFGAFGRERDREEPVLLSPPQRVRAALVMDAHRIVEDLVVLLRRRWKESEGPQW